MTLRAKNKGRDSSWRLTLQLKNWPTEKAFSSKPLGYILRNKFWDSPTRLVVIWGHLFCCPHYTWLIIFQWDSPNSLWSLEVISCVVLITNDWSYLQWRFSYQTCGDLRSFDLLSSSGMAGHTFSEIPLPDMWWFEVIWSVVLITHGWSYLQWDSPTRPMVIWGHLICCPHHAWFAIPVIRTRHNSAHKWIFT